MSERTLDGLPRLTAVAAYCVIAGISDRLLLEADILPFWSYLLRAVILLPPVFSKRPSVHAGCLIATVLVPLALAAFVVDASAA